MKGRRFARAERGSPEGGRQWQHRGCIAIVTQDGTLAADVERLTLWRVRRRWCGATAVGGLVGGRTASEEEEVRRTSALQRCREADRKVAMEQSLDMSPCSRHVERQACMYDRTCCACRNFLPICSSASMRHLGGGEALAHSSVQLFRATSSATHRGVVAQGGRANLVNTLGAQHLDERVAARRADAGLPVRLRLAVPLLVDAMLLHDAAGVTERDVLWQHCAAVDRPASVDLWLPAQQTLCMHAEAVATAAELRCCGRHWAGQSCAGAGGAWCGRGRVHGGCDTPEEERRAAAAEPQRHGGCERRWGEEVDTPLAVRLGVTVLAALPQPREPYRGRHLQPSEPAHHACTPCGLG